VAISVLGEGMDEMEDYVSKFVIDRNPYIEEIGKDAAMKQVDSRGRPEKLKPGFTINRVRDSSAVETDIFKAWTRHVREEEHFIAFGEALKQARSMLFEPDPANPNLTMARAINEKHGNYVFRRVVEEYNRLSTPDIKKARGLLDDILGKFAAGRAVAALAYSLSAYLKNFASIPKWFIEANPIDVFASLADYASDPRGFMERVYAMDPQIAERKGSYIQSAISEGGERSKTFMEDIARELGGEKAQQAVNQVKEAGMNPHAVIDRFVSAIMFDSVYRSAQRRGLAAEQARDEAQRAVQRLLQPSDARDLPPIFTQGGLWRILLMFMSEPVKNLNIVAYDIPRQLANGNKAQALRGAVAITLSGILIKMMADGVPSLGGGDEEEDETLSQWMFEAAMDAFVGQVPVLGAEVMDAIEGSHYSKEYSIVSEPFWKIWHGAKKILEGGGGDRPQDRLMRSGYTKKEWGTLAMAQGFSMLVGAPFSQVKRLYLSRDAKGVADWMLVNIGNRKALERARKNAKERNAANF
jgi:hypothetical protein